MLGFLLFALANSQPAPAVSPLKSSLTTVLNTTYVVSGPGPHFITGVAISTTSGPCIDIRPGATQVVIEKNYLGPCKEHGVNIYQGTNVTIQYNTIDRVMSGVYALDSSQLLIQNNLFVNMQGPFPRGQCFQANQCNSPITFRRNWCHQIINQSYPEDNINFYQTNGSAASPVIIEENVIVGGGPSHSGCGILMGDGYGQYQIARNNVLVNPGQCGIGVASGTFQSVLNNTIISASFNWSNVGVMVWKQYDSACGNVTVLGNLVNWVNDKNQRNDAWNGGGCEPVMGWANNSFWGSTPVQISDIPMSAWNRTGPAGLGGAGVRACVDVGQSSLCASQCEGSCRGFHPFYTEGCVPTSYCSSASNATKDSLCDCKTPAPTASAQANTTTKANSTAPDASAAAAAAAAASIACFALAFVL